MSDKTGGPAFPVEDERMADQTGMTLLDYFAAHVDVSGYKVEAMIEQEIGRTPTVEEFAKWTSFLRYTEARLMMEEREKYGAE